MKLSKTSVLYVAVFIVALMISGCFSADSNTSEGENGVLSYSLYTDYEASGNLSTGILPTLVTHRIEVYSTGAESIGRYDEIIHKVEPSDNAIIITDDDDYSIPDFTIKVSKPGKYTVITKNSRKEIDRITLNFEDPASLKVVTKIREPYKYTFDKAAESSNITTEEGSQVAFIPYFYNADNVRMIGNIGCEYTADPDWMVVPDVEWNSETEDSSWTANYASSYYFIEEGTVTFTIWHEESGMTGRQKFTITPAGE
ncbi:MAG TPA: hypothetical protein PKG52_12250 [bacterium]|nr:hypothetical protein [bacterium]HPS29899.1 hypothetical protein [bacterium]